MPNVSNAVNRMDTVRPTKTDVFMFIAWTMKELSCDAQTKHGCVITNSKNRILGTGYNSFPRECNNDELPNLRPTTKEQEKDPYGNKYPWMIHSEENAVTNCVLKPKDVGGGIAYVTGLCCFPCTRHLWNNGVVEIYQLDRGSHMLRDGYDEQMKTVFCEQVPLKLHIVKADFNFMRGPWQDAKKDGLFHTEFEDWRDIVENTDVS